ncbi:flagellar hook-basal body protein [Myxococcota bacterium]|nr:flagellar hook-basal body protein [Myxococcota bacterium]
MPDMISLIEASMLTDIRRLDVISNNLANASTPGFKRDIAITQAFGEMLSNQMQLGGAGSAFPNPSEIMDSVNTRYTDHSPGSLRPTGNALDVAIEGDGFLVLQGPDGPLYSRSGALSLDDSGRLTGSNGFPVLGNEGEIRLTAVDPRIDAEGTIFEDDERIGSLRLERFEHPEHLRKIGNGLYEAGDQLAVGFDGHTRVSVRQGYLETSNVSTLPEMVLLIELMRRLEANQKVVSSYDEMLGQSLQTIGDL